MPYYAQIQGGKVVAVTQSANAIEAVGLVALDGLRVDLIGAPYEDGVFGVAPAFVAVISSRQGKRALVAADLYQPALAAISAMAEPAKTLALIDWDAPTWQRNDPTLAAMAGALGLTDAQLDALFTQAASL